MFQHMYVAVDNSDHSHRAAHVAVELARAFGARLTACHVYAARLHDYRFKQMEYTLPEEYREEQELERQRKLHNSLIAFGLQLISESYLEAVRARAEAAGLTFEGRAMDGRHYRVLAEDIPRSGCDLAVLGALGMGAGRDSQVGSVAERVIRRISVDTLVVRLLDPLDRLEGAVVAAVDGSARSWRALDAALALGVTLGRPVHALVVEEPGVEGADALQLAERLRARGAAAGVELAISSLQGKAFDRILQFVRKEHPWLLLLGRTGLGAEPEEPGLGSTAAHLLRLAPTNVYLAARTAAPRT